MIFRQVTPKIWQSDEPEAKKVCVDTPKWAELGIKAVICPAFNVRIPYAPSLAALILPVWDDTLIPGEMFDHAVEFHRKFGPTLVHCQGGLNRSVTFAAALAFSEGYSVDTIFRQIGEPVFRQMRDSINRWAEVRKQYPK